MLTRRTLIGAALAAPAIIRPRVLLAQQRRRSRGRQKPPGIPRIDWTHPLAQKLLFYGFDTGAGAVLDLVLSRPGTHVGTRAGNAVTPNGQGIGWNSSDGIFFTSDASIQAATGAGSWTIASAYDITTATEPTNGSPFGRAANNNASAPFVNWSFETAHTSVQSSVAFNYNTAGALGTQTWSGQAANTFTSLAMVAAGTANILCYAQGALIVNAGSLTLQSVNTGDSIGISAESTGGNNPFNGVVYYGAFWARQLSAAEVLQLHFDPYAFLIFPDDEIAGWRP